MIVHYNSFIYKIILTLAVIGAVNWGLVGLFNFDLVTAIAGQGTQFSKLIYSLVGISGFLLLVNLVNSMFARQI